MLNKKLHALFGLLVVLGMILSACAPAVEPTVAVTEPPVVVTEPPVVVEEPTVEVVVAPDAEALFAELVAGLNADNSYGTVSAAKYSEEMVDKPAFLLDVREAADLEKDGYIEGAVNIPVREVLNNLDKLPGLDEPIVVYCASGHRGAMVMSALKLLGYTNVRNLGGGTGGWKKANLPFVTGSMPEAPASISTPIVADQALFEMLNGFLSGLPEGFYSVKSDKLAEELVDAAPVLIDVRTTAEWDKDGYIEGAINIPFNDFFSSTDQLPAKDANIVVYCGSGHRGAIILMAMRLMGYENVRNLAGGLGAWKTANMPVVGWVNWPVVWADYLTNMPEGYYTIKAPDLNTALAENPPFLLDVREASEIEKDGFIAGAVSIPVRDVLNNLDKLPAQDQPIVVYCASGHRGAMVMASLQFLGYTNVKNLAGGLGGWKKAELAVEMGAPVAPVAGTAPDVDATRLANLNKFLTELPEGFYTVKPADLNVELTGSPVPFLLDVRTADEFAAGYIEGAVNININEVAANLAQLPADKAAPIVVMCQSGHRGAMVMMYLRMIGYTNVRNLGGGMNGWIGAELPVAQ
ncbi:MAG: rhodanese-like domain-containing protein [Chloroflexota bacterium]